MRLNNFFSIVIVAVVFFTSCIDKTEAPKPFGALPTEAQLSWHEMEYFSLVCYGLNTYTEVEWAYGDVDPKRFEPSDLNTDQWAETAKDAGMKGLILVAKHHDGFCLWPSKYTDYSVAATPWKDGKGDVLGDLAKSCKKYDLKLGVYLSPWDRNHADYGKPEYVEYYYKQLEELLTEYGEVFEFWIDGANGGTGYYGGANEKRNINRKTYYGYDKIFDIVRKHQPNAVIFSDVGPGSRWVGNEAGIGSEINWNTITTDGKFPGDPAPDYNKKLGSGEKDGKQWIPAEVNTTLLWPKAWYYHTGYKPRTVANLMELYYTSVGRGSPLNLGLAINPEGKISKADSLALIHFRQQVDLAFDTNLALNAKLTASNIRGNSNKYKAENCILKSKNTYWATDDGIQKATIEIDFNKETTFNNLLLQEYISLGQRIHSYSLEIETKNGWKEVISGTTVGYKRVLKFDEVKTLKARITFETDAPCLTLSNLGIFNAPPLINEPSIEYDVDGTISLKSDPNHDIFFNINGADFQKYLAPITLPNGGTVSAYAIDKVNKYKSEVVSEKFGMAKNNWKIYDVSSENKKDAPAISAIDGDSHSHWISKAKDSKHFVAINLGEEVSIAGFSYLPCKNGCKGTIYEYEFHTSLDGKNWGKPQSCGEFSNIKNNPTKQVINFDSPVKARYVKLVSKSAVDNSKQASTAEIGIFVAN